jgi:hypothetical protein
MKRMVAQCLEDSNVGKRRIQEAGVRIQESESHGEEDIARRARRTRRCKKGRPGIELVCRNHALARLFLAQAGERVGQ